jgi:hypothetical protein
METVVAAGWPNDEFVSLFHQATSSDRKFSPFYEWNVRFLEPKWGGNWDLVDKFIRDASVMIGEPEGPGMYARLYVALDTGECCDFDVLAETRLKWSQMRTSFDALTKLYPHSARFANKFAAFACRADDKDTYLRQRYLLGKAVTPDQWRTGYSVDRCDRKFGVQTP